MFRCFIFCVFLLLTQSAFAVVSPGGLGFSFSRPILGTTSIDALSRKDVYAQLTFSIMELDFKRPEGLPDSASVNALWKGRLGYYFSGGTNPEDRFDFFSISTDAVVYLGRNGDLFRPYLGYGVGIYYYGPRKPASNFRTNDDHILEWKADDFAFLPDIAVMPYVFGGAAFGS